jgi:hypothetical protein
MLILEYSPRLLRGANVDPAGFVNKLRYLGFNISKISEAGELSSFDEVMFLAHAGEYDSENLFCERSEGGCQGYVGK